MTGIVVGDLVPALDNPEPSATKLGRRWGERVDWDAPAGPAPTSAPLAKPMGDASVRAYAPQWITGSFRVPYGMRQAQLESHCRDMATRWFAEMERRGFDPASGTSLQVNPGPNPSKDLASGLEIPGYRDYLLTAQFVERHPEVIRLEVPGELFEPWQPSQLATSSGDDEE